MDRPTSVAKGPYGRGTSFGRDTSGYKGWMPVVFAAPGGKTQEGFKNVLTNQEFIPPNGHNGEPPGPTGELIAKGPSDLYREGWERIWGPKVEVLPIEVGKCVFDKESNHAVS